MYRTCIYCSAGLGANEAIEAFPVGRSVAFDAGKGRLWAVCPKCARWNLAPIEERWEAVEEAERIFRDTRLRVQRENVGLAKLRDGTRLVRVGDALRGELAAWRYGETLERRRRRALLAGGAGTAVMVSAIVLGVTGVGSVLLGASLAVNALTGKWARKQDDRPIGRVPTGDGAAEPTVMVRRQHLAGARLVAAENGVAVRFPTLGVVRERLGDSEVVRIHEHPVLLDAAHAQRILPRAMVAVNDAGARRDVVQRAMARIAENGSGQGFLARAAERGIDLAPAGDGRRPSATTWIASRWRSRCTRRRSAARWTASWPRCGRCGARPRRSPTSRTACRTARERRTRR